jgi:ankyrin repeat protein
MHAGTSAQHEAVVKLLLEKSADMESKDKYGKTPLLRAAEKGQEAVVRLLMDRVVDVNVREPLFNRTALILAAAGGHEAVVRLLVEKDATSHQEALWWAARRGHEAVVRLLGSARGI